MKSVSHHLLLVVVITTIGVWGCSQSGTDARSAAAKIRHLEYRNTKLEEDYRASVAEVAALKKKLTAALKQVEDVSKHNEELQTTAREREELQQKLNLSVGERDALRIQLTTFSKELQALAGRVEQAAGNGKNAGVVKTVSQQK
jgi:predicted RNase H-like nuclease (RuvC/YqgF family)